mgnify:CR=1 FL=1
MNAFQERRKRLADTLAPAGLAMAVFEDTEGRRDPSIRYFTGQPSDALLFIAANGKSILVAWDVNMAAAMAIVDKVEAYTDFGRSPYNAVSGALKALGIPTGPKWTFPPPRRIPCISGTLRKTRTTTLSAPRTARPRRPRTCARSRTPTN